MREAAARAFSALGPSATQYAEHILPLLKDNTADVRTAAALTFAAMGPSAANYSSKLLSLLQDTNKPVRDAATTALAAADAAALEQSADHLISLFAAEEWGTRAAAAKAFSAMGPSTARHVQHILPLLADKEWPVRAAAADLFSAMGPSAAQHAQRLLPLLEDKERGVRAATVKAFASMGPSAAQHIQHLIPLLEDKEVDVRLATAKAFAAIGPSVVQYASHLLPLLELPKRSDLIESDEGHIMVKGDEREDIRKTWAAQATAIKSFAAMGPAAAQYTPHILPLFDADSRETRIAVAQAFAAIGPSSIRHIRPLLNNGNWSVRETAAKAFAAMGPSITQQLLPLMKEEPWNVRASAARGLAYLGPAVASQHAQHLLPLLKDSQLEVREAAAMAFAAMGRSSEQYSQDIRPLLKDEKWRVRSAAMTVFAAMGPATVTYAPDLLPLLKDEDMDVVRATVDAFAAMGPASAEYAEHLLPFLGPKTWADFYSYDDWRDRVHKYWDVRESAAKAFLAMGPSAARYSATFIPLLWDEGLSLNSTAAEVLAVTCPADPKAFAAIMARTHDDDPSSRSVWLLRAHVLGNGQPKVEQVLRWLGRTSDERPGRITGDEARETLRAFAELWPYAEAHQRLRDDLAAQIAAVTHLAHTEWIDTDTELLKHHEQILRDAYPKEATILRNSIPASNDFFNIFGWSVTIHAGFWILLLLFYPRFAQVQAVFFWNPWVRKITGFGYVGLLLTWVPFLRRRLLAPFEGLLLAEAQLERFSAGAYFDRSEVLTHPSAQRESLLRTLPYLQGQVVLEGASGLGKSMFLKHLLSTSKRLAVYLPAERCKAGVLEAIQAKLEGHAQDTTFLRSLIYSGGLDIYIDGLNEVTADTRARIVQFVEQNIYGNIILTTQPLEWTPPATAKIYTLQPLAEEEIVRFLETRDAALGDKERLRGQAYMQACQSFVAECMSADLPAELRHANCEVLSNPMDLTVVAQLLADGRQPNLFHLRRQQYELMAKDYRDVHLSEFPLKEFSEEAYLMRREDRPALSEERFARELLRMEAAKMVVRQQWRSPDGREQRQWHFRHDKIQEFFIAQTFLGKENPRATKHLKDPRFRGVYLLLALLLDPAQARALCNVLVEHAAETRDHSVSDDFVTLLKKRQNAERALATQAGRKGEPIR